MIELVLAPVDLSRVRFGHSPVRELVASIRCLNDPRREAVYAGWRRTAVGRLAGFDLDLLAALSPVDTYAWDFLAPPIARQWADLGDELEAIAATPPAVVRAELHRYGPVPEPLRRLAENPARELPRIVALLAAYWDAAVAPVWSQVRALTTADLTTRTEQFATGGLAAVLGQLHGELVFDGDRIRIDKPYHCVHRYDLSGQGVLLVPCAFSWPTLVVWCCEADQPALLYPTRGAATIGEPAGAPMAADPLHAVLGKGRAGILAALGEPRSTSRLAADLDLSPSAVSQHLKALRAAGLVSSRRRGRHVLYHRTGAAASLLAATDPRA